MRQHLTELGIRQLPNPPKGSVKVMDTTLPGFGVRCTKSSKSFFVMYGKGRNLKTLGKWPQMPLKDARRDAKGILAKPPKKRATRDIDALTAFLADCSTRLRQSTTDRYTFSLAPHRNGINLSTTDPNELKALKAFYNWSIAHGLRDDNPVARRTVRFGIRDRLLTDQEIYTLLHYDHKPYSVIVKLLIYTGQRRSQFAHFDPSWIEGDTIVFPARIMKSNRIHTIPATPTVLSLLPHLSTYSGWSKSKKRMDEKTGITNYVLHDFRRYFSSTMARLAVPLHITEQLLDHRSTISGVAAIYNLYSFQKEMREALETYEKHLASIKPPEGTS